MPRPPKVRKVISQTAETITVKRPGKPVHRDTLRKTGHKRKR